MMKDRKVFYRKVLWKKEHGKKSQKRKDFFYKKDVIYLFEILYFAYKKREQKDGRDDDESKGREESCKVFDAKINDDMSCER